MSEPTMETWQVLEKAAALIEERGWTTGDFEDITGAVCALGAIGTVVYGPEAGGEFDYLALARDPAVRLLAASVNGSGEPDMAVYQWNDSRTDATEVVDTMRRVAQAEWERSYAKH